MTPACPHEPKVAKGLCSRCYKRQLRGTPLSAPVRAAPGEGAQVSLRCSQAQREAWERAAKHAKQSFRDWIRAVLDREAKRSGAREITRATEDAWGYDKEFKR